MQLLIFDRQDLRSHEAGGFSGADGDVLKPHHHALVIAVGLVFRSLQHRVVGNSLADPIQFRIEFQTLGEHLGTFGKLAMIFLVARRLFFKFLQALFPGIIVWEQRTEVPGIVDIDFGPLRQANYFIHDWKTQTTGSK